MQMIAALEALRKGEKDSGDYIFGNHYTLNVSVTSLGCIPGKSNLRLKLFRMIDSALFSVVIGITIATNVATTVIDTPGWRDLPGATTTLFALDIAFQIVFTLEMLMKIVALGLLLHHHAYLRSLQNLTDAALVMLGFFQFSAGSALVRPMIRLVRSLRSFTFLTRFALLRAIFITLHRALPKLRDILLLTFFVIITMAVLGLQLFIGTVHQRCYLLSAAFDENGTAIPNATAWVVDPNFPDIACSNNPGLGFKCATPNTTCARHDDVFHFAYRNFDYIWTSVYAVFKFIVQDNWSDDIHRLQNANGAPYFFFALAIVLFGTFFALNLVVAVLSEEYESVAEELLEKEKEVKALMSERLVEELGLGDAAKIADSVMETVASFGRTDEENAEEMEHHFAKTAGRHEEAVHQVEGADEGDESHAQAASHAAGGIVCQDARGVLWRHVVSTNWFRRVSFGVTLINVVVLATDHYGIDPTWGAVNYWINFACTVFFFIEAILKMCVMGVLYFRDPFNIFDLVICGVSAGELALNAGSGGSSVTALRAFRLLRLVRLLNSNRRAQQLIKTIAQAGKTSSLLFLTLLMYVIAGGVFATLVHPNAVEPANRPNYTNFLNSVLSTFLVVSGENWNDYVTAILDGYSPNMLVFYLPYVIFSTFVVVNFVVVVLINAFNDGNADEDDDAEAAAIARELERVEKADMMAAQHAATMIQDDLADARAEAVRQFNADAEAEAHHDGGEAEQFNPLGPPIPAGEDQAASGGGDDIPVISTAPAETGIVEDAVTLVDNAANAVADGATAVVLQTKRLFFVTFYTAISQFFGLPRTPEERAEFVTGRSFKIFSPDNALRRACAFIVLNPLYEFVAMLIVLEGCAALAMDNKQTRAGNATADSFIYTSFLLNIAFFSLELVLKTITFGVFIGDKAYFRNKWNVADFLILVVSFLAFTNLPLRPLQAIRIFRIATRWPDMRIILWSLGSAVPGVFNIVALLVFVFVVCGIVGVQLFKGRLFSCSDSSITTRAECVGFATAQQTTYYDDGSGVFLPMVSNATSPRVWAPNFFNFDHLGFAGLSMVLLQYGNGWSSLLFPIMDAADNDYTGTSQNNSWGWAFLVVYLFMQNNYFLNNLFVGSLIDSFSEQRELTIGSRDANGKPLLTDAQERWIREYRFAKSIRLPTMISKPEFPLRRLAAWIYFADETRVDGRRSFDLFITFCIVLNVLLMMSQFDGQPEYWTTVLFSSYVTFAIIFTLEFLIKIVAMMPRPYFDDRWNVFDFLLVIAAIISVFLDGPGTNALRVLRVARIMRLVRRAKGLNRLFESLLYALPQLFNVIVLTAIVLFVFSIGGVAIFEDLYIDPLGGGTFGPVANFRDVPMALMTLFEVVSGAWWADPMQAGLITEQNSGCSNAEGSCGTMLSYPFFLLAMLFGNSVCVNLFIFVVVENYNEVSQISTQTSQYLLFRLESFRRRWVFADPNRDGLVPWRVFVHMIRILRVTQEEEYNTFLSEVWIDEDHGVDDAIEREFADAPSDEEGEAPEPQSSKAGQGDGAPEARLRNSPGNGRPPPPHVRIATMSSHLTLEAARSMDVPVSDYGLVAYEDCVLGVVRDFYRIEGTEMSSEGHAFLSAITGCELHRVFKVHHALAAHTIARALRRRMEARRAAKNAVEATTLMVEECLD